MLILSAAGVKKSYGAEEVLSGISFQVNDGDKIGLIGINGAGKSTLLKIIAGEIYPDEGEITKGKDISIGYLAQESNLEGDNTLWQETAGVFDYLKDMEKNLRELERKMGERRALEDEAYLNKLMKEYSSLVDRFHKSEGYEYESRIRGVLSGLGFTPEEYEKPVSTLSGGQKTRLALGKLLLKKPSLLLLDEPTNYLDMETTEWLEDYLKDYRGAIIIISHDRFFLDSLVTRVFEIEGRRLLEFKGNYTDYVRQKEKLREQEQKMYSRQQEEIQRLKEQIRRQKAWRNFSQANSRIKTLERMEIMDRPPLPPKKARISFDPEIKSGKEVLKVENLSKEFNGRLLFKGVSFQIVKGDRIGLIGPNGTGKSTLLKILAGFIPPSEGAITPGHNVRVSYYHQELEDLNPENTVLDEVWQVVPKMPQGQLRTILGSFLFSGEDVFKKIHTLSGGEKSRVSLAKLMLSRGNFLLIDEPTNHLDMVSKESLERALLNYTGTLFMVSHDRYFLNRVATRIFELKDNTLNIYNGNYSYYLEKKKALEKKEQEKIIEVRENKKKENTLKEQAEREKKKKEREIKQIEEEILELEERLKYLEELLCQEDVYSDETKAGEINREYQNTRKELENLYSLWAKRLESDDTG